MISAKEKVGLADKFRRLVKGKSSRWTAEAFVYKKYAVTVNRVSDQPVIVGLKIFDNEGSFVDIVWLEDGELNAVSVK